MSRKLSGLRAWVLQRATAIYIGLFSVVIALVLLISPPADYEQWRDWFADPLVGIATLVFIVSILLHAWVGIRDILIDYIKPLWLRLTLMALVALGLLTWGLWASQSLILVRLV